MLRIAHSYYSLRYGTLSVEDLVELGAEAGLKRLVLADINNTAGLPDFVKACHRADILPIAGMDIFKENHRLYTLIARNANGFREMNEFISQYNSRTEPPDIFTSAQSSRSPACHSIHHFCQ